MSIILKGIDMPKEKDEALLLLILGDGTVAEKIGSDRYEEMTDTQAIQIPKPHGRIIDESEWVSHKVLEPMGNGQYEEVEVVYKGDIYNAPTILEAEE